MRLAKELRGHAQRAGQQDGFDQWIRQLRTDNARRRALQDEFTIAGLPRCTDQGVVGGRRGIRCGNPRRTYGDSAKSRQS